MTLKETLKAMGCMYPNVQTRESISMLLLDLQDYPEDQILLALKKCRMELKFFPSLSEILERLEGGHPEANEAWALCPRSEDASVCWTKEIEKAYFSAVPLIYENDFVAARMAFIEVYKREISNAKVNKKRPTWHLSLGTNKLGREIAINEAIKSKKITYEQGQKLLPLSKISDNNDVLKLLETFVEKEIK